MKSRTTSAVIAALLLCALPAAAADKGGPSSVIALEVGVSPQLGIFYAGALDPALSGAALQAMVTWARGILRFKAGLEAGESPLGWQVLAPLRVGLGITRAPLKFETLLEAAPGAALFQQGALFIIALGAIVEASWYVTPWFALYLAPGVRWTTCPAYLLVDRTSYGSLDLPLTLGMRFSF
jgi:hypothetical protein